MITLEQRWRAAGHKSGILWLTGLSGAGKTTLAQGLDQALFERGWRSGVLDGDALRKHFSADLGFSKADRDENVRRVGETAIVMAETGCIAIVALISPYAATRAQVRARAGNLFHEIYLSGTLAVCEGRDPKGLYAKARSGMIANYTGLSDPYEPPEAPELALDTGVMTVGESLGRLLGYAEGVFGLG